jgi:glycosyltransferase involved in cell wall biosynthesis
MREPAWHILSGEYPPAPGGVADYARSVARALAAAGDEVHVWAPAQPGPLAEDPGVSLHPIPGGYSPRGLAALSRAFDRQPPPRRVLVQYVPQAFGMKSMNLAFCVWLAGLRNAQVWTMFHEVAVPWGPWWRWRQNAVATVTRLMARLLLSRADRVLVSIPSWETVLRPLAPHWTGATWLPIPSNVPTLAPSETAARVRARLPLPVGGRVVGHFGTYGALVAPTLMRTVSTLLQSDPRRIALLIGRGSAAVARNLLLEPGVAGRVVAPGALEADDVAAHLLACDVLVQPYPDGVSTRRTSAMAGLALGVPTATNAGPATEPVWRGSKAVELSPSADSLAAAAESVLGDAVRAAALGQRGRALYERQFSLEHTICALRNAGRTGLA